MGCDLPQKQKDNTVKKYAVIDWKDDSFEAIFDTEKEALAEAEYQWDHLTTAERAKRETFAVMHGEVDEDGCFNINTAETIKSYK